MRLEARLYRFSHGDDQDPDTVAEVLVNEDQDRDEFLVPGSDFVIGDRRFNVYRIEHSESVYTSLSVCTHREFTLLLFGHVGDGMWYKYRATCRRTS